jgi:hypothetical protein
LNILSSRRKPSHAPSGDTNGAVDVFVRDRGACFAYGPCDTNCDGSINGFDVESFVALLSGSE